MAARRITRRLDSSIKRPDGKGVVLNIERMILGPVQTNCYLIENRDIGEGIVIDPADKAEEIIDALQEKGIRAAAVLLTHGHFDHGMAAEEVAAHFQSPVYAGELELPTLRSEEKTASFLLPGIHFTLEPDILLHAGEELVLAGIRMKIFFTPGHTEGGISIYLPDYQMVFSGDTLFHGGVGRTDLPGGNSKVLYDSLFNVLMELPDGTIVLPGHGGSTTIEMERRYNPYLEESWFLE